MRYQSFVQNLIQLLLLLSFIPVSPHALAHLREQRTYYWWKKFDYINYQLNRLETRLDRARDFVRRRQLFRNELAEYLQEQQTRRNPVQAALAQYRLEEWCILSHCEICKLLRKVDTVQRQLCYEWRELDLGAKLAWIETAQQQCADDLELQSLHRLAHKIQHKYERLERGHRELHRYAKRACRY
ncbi:MAG TPA: hypothetical protein VJJ83_04285 [Candidatus Babeliales bacterium]|nr:hypothetical protein [Candidatus Babeliales bacterium]